MHIPAGQNGSIQSIGSLKRLLCGGVWMMMFATAVASPNLSAGGPLEFFTNVASRLLSRELNANLSQIQVYPTNQYTPSVHRLLQVAANVYEATTTNFYPSVFRPMFTNDGAMVFISSYQPVVSVTGAADPQLALPVDADSLPLGTSTTNVYGIPWIIGAKKGFPNFNKFAMQNVVQISRRLQIARSTIPTTSIADFLYTNQLLTFSISNSIGVECWNSYSNYYPNPVEVCVRDTISMQITNDAGAPDSHFYNVPLNADVSVASWPGSAWHAFPLNGLPAVNSFIAPFTNTTVVLLTNSDFYFGSTPPGSLGFYPDGLNLGWETNKHDFQFPRFGLLTTNRLQVFMLDGTNVIDYVHFAGPESSRDLNGEIQNTNNFSGYDSMWSTNLTWQGAPQGIQSQIDVSDGSVALNPTYWSNPEASDEIDGFFVFMGGSPNAMPYPVNNINVVQFYATNYIGQVPYTPTVTTYEYTSWQANDPLVHYLVSDLTFYGTEKNGPTTGTNTLYGGRSMMLRPSFNTLNDRYQPWGRLFPTSSVDPNPCNLAYKDPLVRGSDNWNFPTNETSFAGWIGQVHRGTPWQTLYLKATNILNWVTPAPQPNGTSTWKYWTGDFDGSDAVAMAPVRDRSIVNLLAALLNTNDFRTLFSVNNSDPNAWRVLFDGLIALSNNVPDSIAFRFGGIPPQYDSLIISSNSPPASLMVNAIQSAHAGQPNWYFSDIGDILAVPQLTEQSPFLNRSSGTQLTNGISDEAYEKIPSQLLPLLRADSIGAVVANSSQALVQFTGYDDYAYAVQVSPDLVSWTSIGTNYPVNGVFSFTNASALSAGQQFYRSIWLR